MFDVQRVEGKFGDLNLSLETGRIGRQANGAVIAQLGDTMVLAAVVMAPLSRDLGFFPLTVDYREKLSAAGKFPGGFLKREGRPTTKETLTCRLIDRPIRPMFPDGLGCEIQVSTMVLSADQQVDPDVLAVIATTAALHISDIPFDGTLGAVRVGRVADPDKPNAHKLVAFPTANERDGSTLDLVIAGSRDATLMVEAGASEISEADLLDALEFGNKQIQRVIDLIEKLGRKAKKPKVAFTPPAKDEALHALVDATYRPRAREAMLKSAKSERGAAFAELAGQIVKDLCPKEPVPGATVYDPGKVKEAVEALKRSILRRMTIDESRRLDGRGLEDIRPITGEVGFLPRVHGSALFTRGETQAVVMLALGTTYDEQRVDGLMPEYTERFMLHYQFPPFSVGEVKPIRGPGRREIGHGMLAQRALEAVVPPPDAFPYTIKISSDITESNGSSSMASVCGGTLAMMDAGVPIRRPVAGIAMGLIVEGADFRILSDIIGAEDHDGDMDFKVAGTDRGVTALQLDCKVSGISREMMAKALEQARQGRLKILKEMLKVIGRPNAELKRYAPRVIRMKIDPEKIGMVIGPGGKHIRKIQETSGAQIAIEDDGVVSIFSADQASAESAMDTIKSLTANAEVGAIYKGRVTSIKDFGCFVEILPNQEGLCHISEIANGYVQNVRDVVREGDEIEVKVLAIDDQGRVKLSKKALDIERGITFGPPQGDAGEGQGEGHRPGPDRPPRQERPERPRRSRG